MWISIIEKIGKLSKMFSSESLNSKSKEIYRICRKKPWNKTRGIVDMRFEVE